VIHPQRMRRSVPCSPWLATGKRPFSIRNCTQAETQRSCSLPAGAVYYDAGQHKRAIGHLRKATELDPNFDEAFYQLGLLCLEMNWLKKAQECFKTAQAQSKRKPVPQAGTQLFRGSNRPDKLNGLIREELRLVKYPAAPSGRSN